MGAESFVEVEPTMGGEDFACLRARWHREQLRRRCSVGLATRKKKETVSPLSSHCPYVCHHTALAQVPPRPPARRDGLSRHRQPLARHRDVGKGMHKSLPLFDGSACEQVPT